MSTGYLLGEMLKQGEEEGKEYCFGFVDIRKAYDRVDRDVLWERMEKAGYGGKMLNLIKGMYEDNRGRFRLGELRTRWMRRNRGLRQGCVLSPFLFAMYIGGVVNRLKEQGLGIRIGGEVIPILVFADDMVLCAENEEEMKKMMGIIHKELAELGLEVNEKKSLIIRLGEKAKKGTVWELRTVRRKLMAIEEGEDYKYLGVYVSQLGKRGVQAVGKEVLHKAEKMVRVLLEELKDSYDRTHEGKVLWERVAIPKILYGLEVARLDPKILDGLEKLQVRMGRKVLGVGPLVANEVVLWELGWLPIQGRIAMMKERFYSKLQWGGAKLSSAVFRERKDKGWAKDTQDFLKFYVEDAEAIGKCYFKEKCGQKLRKFGET